MDQKLVSVLICHYNSRKFIFESVLSILNQTYRNIELIIIDDGSTDDSHLELDKFTDSRIRKFRNEKNMGITYSYNKAIKMSKGEFISIMDSDDICHKDKIKIQMEYLLENNLDVCGTEAITFGNTRKMKLHCLEYDNDIKTLMLIGNPMIHPTILIKSKVIKKYYYLDYYKVGMDFDLFSRMALDGVKFGNVKEPLIKSRWHRNQNTFKNHKQGMKDAYDICINYCSQQSDIFFQLKYLKRINLGFKKEISYKEFIFCVVAMSIIIKKRKSNMKIFEIFVRQLFKSLSKQKPNYFFSLLYIIKKYKIRLEKRDIFLFFLQSFLFLNTNSKIYENLLKFVNFFRIKI